MVTYLDLLNKARKKNGAAATDASTLAAGSAGTISNIEFVDDVVAIAYQQSLDWGFNDYIENIVLTSGSATVPTASLAVEWDPNAVKEVKYVDAADGNRKKPLVFITPTRADDLAPTFTSDSKPIYYYIDQDVLKVLPVPDSAYTVTVRFQGLMPEVTTNNIGTSIGIPRTLQKALVEGIYSRLLHEDGDPEWVTWEQNFLTKLSNALSNNRNNYRRAGLKKYRLKRSLDFRL